MKSPEQIEIDKKRKDKKFRWLTLDRQISQDSNEHKGNSTSVSALTVQEEKTSDTDISGRSSEKEKDEVEVCHKEDRLIGSSVENNNPLNTYLQTDFSSVPLSWDQELKIRELVSELESLPFENVINKFSDKVFENNYNQQLVLNNLNPTLHKIALNRFLKKVKVIKIETRFKGELIFNWVTQNKPLEIIDKDIKHLKSLNLLRWW